MTTTTSPRLGNATTVNGLAVYHRPADGPSAGTLVLVHGTNQNASRFRRATPLLGEFEIVTFDRRGFAGSAGKGNTTIAGCIADIAAVVEYATEATGDQPILIGSSWAGGLSLGYAEQHPGTLRGMALWEASDLTRFWPDEWLQLARDTAKLSGLEMLVIEKGGEEAWEALSPAVKDKLLADVEGIVADALLAPDERAFEHPETVTVPVMLGIGDVGDWPHEIEATKWLYDQLPTRALVTFPGVPHMAHWRNPSEFASFVRMAEVFIRTMADAD